MRIRPPLIVLALPLIVVACTDTPPPIDPAYRAEIEAAWAEREARLVADDGWLTLTGLFWLEPGPNTVGSSPESAVRLPDGAAPSEVGVLDLRADGRVTLVPSPNGGLTINGEPAIERPLASDAAGSPDLLRAGRVLFYLLARGDRTGVRVKDPEAAARREFAGIQHFPVDPAFRVTATFEPYPEPREVAIPTVIGTPSMMLAPGMLRFEIRGETVSIEPYVSEPSDRELFIVFRDATSGDTTYGAGRFLDAERIKGSDEVILDFNLATNPPCAFSPFATCPLPTPENSLRIPIEAGEKYSGDVH
jgi:uncharacterized protein (DUF1684 family)